MKSLCDKKKSRGRFEKLFECVEMELIKVTQEESEQIICAVVKALLEIDQNRVQEDSLAENHKEAS